MGSVMYQTVIRSLEDTLIDEIEQKLGELLPDQKPYDRLNMAQALAECIELGEMIEQKAEEMTAGLLEDEKAESFDNGAAEERLIADTEISEAYNEGYQDARDGNGHRLA